MSLTHNVWVDAYAAVADNSSQGSERVLLDSVFASKDEGCGAIIDTRSITCRDNSSLLEGSRQFGENLHCCLWSGVLVNIEGNLLAFHLDSHWDYFIFELSILLSLSPPFL